MQKAIRRGDAKLAGYWAIYVDGELLAVTLYQKGAQAIADLIMKMRFSKEAGDAA